MIVGVVFLAVLLTALVTVPVTALIARRPRQPFPLAHRLLLDEAMALLMRMRHSTDIDHLDTLSDRSRQAADRLLARYNKEVNR